MELTHKEEELLTVLRIKKIEDNITFLVQDPTNIEYIKSLKKHKKRKLNMTLIKEVLTEIRTSWFNGSQGFIGMSIDKFTILEKILNKYGTHGYNKDEFKYPMLYGLPIIINNDFRNWMYIFSYNSLSFKEKVIIVRPQSITRVKL